MPRREVICQNRYVFLARFSNLTCSVSDRSKDVFGQHFYDLGVRQKSNVPSKISKVWSLCSQCLEFAWKWAWVTVLKCAIRLCQWNRDDDSFYSVLKMFWILRNLFSFYRHLAAPVIVTFLMIYLKKTDSIFKWSSHCLREYQKQSIHSSRLTFSVHFFSHKSANYFEIICLPILFQSANCQNL